MNLHTIDLNLKYLDRATCTGLGEAQELLTVAQELQREGQTIVAAQQKAQQKAQARAQARQQRAQEKAQAKAAQKAAKAPTAAPGGERV